MAELVHSVQSFMNAEDVIIAKKRKRALVQRRPRQERGRIETVGRQAHPQEGVNTTRP